LTVHFARCILPALSLPQSATWLMFEDASRTASRPAAPEAGTGRFCRRDYFHDRLPKCRSLLTQCGSAATLRGEMGSFPFASTIGTMLNSSSAAAIARTSHWAWRGGSHSRRWSPSSVHPSAHIRPTFHFASCSGTAQCPDAVARPAELRGGVSRRTSGRTLTRSERGDRAVAERGPPSPRPSC